MKLAPVKKPLMQTQVENTRAKADELFDLGQFKDAAEKYVELARLLENGGLCDEIAQAYWNASISYESQAAFLKRGNFEESNVMLNQAILMARKAKYYYFPDEDNRKACDHIIARIETELQLGDQWPREGEELTVAALAVRGCYLAGLDVNNDDPDLSNQECYAKAYFRLRPVMEMLRTKNQLTAEEGKIYLAAKSMHQDIVKLANTDLEITEIESAIDARLSKK